MHKTQRKEKHFHFTVLMAAMVIGLGSQSCEEDWHEIDFEDDNNALETEDETKGGIEALMDPDEIPYRHPILQDGIPNEALFAENPLSPPDGTNYALIDSITSDVEGNEETYSSVVELETHQLSSEESAELQEIKESLYALTEQTTPESYLDKLDPKLVDLLEEAASSDFPSTTYDDIYEVVITAYRNESTTVTVEIEKALAKGEIVTMGDYHKIHKKIVEERQNRIVDEMEPTLKTVTDLGGTILFTPQNTHSLVAEIPLSIVENLAKNEAIARMSLSRQLENDVNGNHVIEGHQIKQFIDDGYDGENLGNRSPDYDITFAQLEGTGANDEHVGFREDSTTVSRIRGRFDCDGSGCTSVSNFPPSSENEHATLVAGIIFGDLRDSQDPPITSQTDRIARSGYAGESKGWLFRALSTAATFDHIAGMTGSTAPVLVNMSAYLEYVDETCKGSDNYSQSANRVYESGKFVLKTAGNLFHGSTTDCTVSCPGSAIGAFTVGATGDGYTGDTDDVRNDPISDYSSRGGTVIEGGGRTIIDMAAYGGREMMFDINGGYNRHTEGTSISAPTITAAAIDFIDFYKNTYSNLIDDPGVLFSNLLLMGDRMGQFGRKRWGYDNLYGAGNFRARRWDGSGMDSPYAWTTIRTCIDDGEVYTVTINNGNTIPPDVETFKAVVWWYDGRHDDGVRGPSPQMDDIDLRLRRTNGTLLRQSVTLDNKERVYYDVGGLAVKLEVIGANVTADYEGCGENSMRVFISYYWEDTDRDDGDGPGSEIEPW